MKNLRYILMLTMLPVWVQAQQQPESLSLEQCYQQVENHYPATRDFSIQNKITALNARIAGNGWYPDVQLSAGASYQSDVTEIPFSAPGTTPTEFSKDHYNLSLEIQQPVYDGGRTSASKKLEMEKGQLEHTGIEISLWKVRAQTEQLYFTILYLDQKIRSVDLNIQDLEDQVELLEERYRNGTVLESNVHILRAQLLKLQQTRIQIKFDRESAYGILSELTGTAISPDTRLMLPDLTLENLESLPSKRPELKAFRQQRQVLELQDKMQSSVQKPVISAFARTAYGRPGLDAFNDELQAYWLVGLKAQWGFKNWNNSRLHSETLQWKVKSIETEEETFNLQLRASLVSLHKELERLNRQISMDEEIVRLHQQIVEDKKNQLAQGVITSTEYLSEMNAESQARLNLEVRKVKKIQTLVEFSTKKGIKWN